jgi:hypothetical protein
MRPPSLPAVDAREDLSMGFKEQIPCQPAERAGVRRNIATEF